MFVKLPNGNQVNPEYVTCIELFDVSGKPWTRLWVVKDAGYNTGSYSFSGDQRDELARLLNCQLPIDK